MKIRLKNIFTCAMAAACLCAVLSIGVSADEYSFSGAAAAEFYPSQSYEDVYGAAYNYGGMNVSDFKLPDLPYGTESNTLSGSMEKVPLYGSRLTYAEKEENESCRAMIEDNIREIGEGIASEAIRHRFFIIFEYEMQMKAKRNTVRGIVDRLNEEADTARRYLDLCELEVLEPRYMDNFMLQLLYEIINKKTSRRVKLPEGVFDMTTAIHGIYEQQG